MRLVTNSPLAREAILALFPEAALILSGGHSRRLGLDKAAIVFAGQTLLAGMVGLARAYCSTVAVCGRDPALFGVSAEWFADEQGGCGPMGGIVTGLKNLGGTCLVLPCDLPFMDGPTLERLFEAWRKKPAQAVLTTFGQTWTGYIEALVAVYEPEAEEILRQGLARGQSLARMMPSHLIHRVGYTQAQSKPFFNLNTPEDLTKLRLETSPGQPFAQNVPTP